MTTTTQTAKVAAALIDGAELTAKQISSRYGVKNVRAVISKLRSEGLSIYLNNRVSSFDGETPLPSSIILYCNPEAVVLMPGCCLFFFKKSAFNVFNIKDHRFFC